MDGSDEDYFNNDDLVIDDNVLAVLDQEEKKFALSSTQQPAPAQSKPAALAPSKRQKTDVGWKPGVGSVFENASPSQEENLPEISVRGDGTYALGTAGSTRNAAASHGQSRPVQPQPARAAQTAAVGAGASRNFGRSQSASSIAGPSSQVARAQAPNNRPQSLNRSTSYQARSAAPPSRPPSLHVPPPAQTDPLRSQPLSQRGQLSRKASIQAALARPPSPAPQPTVPQPPVQISSPQLEAAEALQRQVEELRKENEKMQRELQDAIDKKLAKEGEVSVLRKGMEKTAKDHASQIERLRREKEEADARQAQAQRERKEEMDRLKTQFTFRQHEMETTLRKTALSSRSKRTRDVPPTPTSVPVPSQIRGWSTRTPVQETPRRPRHANMSVSPRTNRKPGQGEPHPPPHPQKGAFGFFNSFDPAPDVPMPMPVSAGKAKGKGKGKGKEKEVVSVSPLRRGAGASRSSPPSSPTRLPRTARTEVQTPARTEEVFDVRMDSDPDPGGGMDGVADVDVDPDVDMTDYASVSQEYVEEMEEFEPLDLREELHQIILSHTCPPSTGTIPTFQALLRVVLPEETGMAPLEKYTGACSQVLAVLGGSRYEHEYDECEGAFAVVANALAQMGAVLCAAGLTQPLAALLDLLTLLITSIPTFSVAFARRTRRQHSQDRIVVVLCDVVRAHLAPKYWKPDCTVREDTERLAREVLSLLEALAWTLPDDLSDQLGEVCADLDMLAILLEPSMPTWVLERSTRVLKLLSTRQDLFRPLLSYPSAVVPPKEGLDYGKIPHIERMSMLLSDMERHEPEVESMKVNILTFFSMLSVVDKDSPGVLLNSRTLILSLVLFIAHLTTPLWEDDDELIGSPAKTTSSIELLTQSVFLLRHLLFSGDQILAQSLRAKLHYAQGPEFNGVHHMFIVTFSRLGYGETPYWVQAGDAAMLEDVVEIARELLDLVVGGLEVESIWNAFNEAVPDADGGEISDDEEIAAQLQGESHTMVS